MLIIIPRRGYRLRWDFGKELKPLATEPTVGTDLSPGASLFGATLASQRTAEIELSSFGGHKR